MTDTTEPTELLTIADGRDTLVEVGAVIDVALAAGLPHVLDAERGIYTVTVPQGGRAAIIDLEDRLASRQPAPSRKRGNVTTLTAAAFAGYVNRHKAPEVDVPPVELWAQLEQQRMVAVLNPHTETPGWGDHRAYLQCKRTVAWAAWLAADGQLVDQEAFAQYIEDHTLDIARPDGATMLEVAQSLYASTDVQFRSAKRLIDGQGAHVYIESTTATAGTDGQLDIPAEFFLRLAPFEGSDIVEVIARLRWRIQQQQLRIGFRLDRPDEVERKAFDTVVANVEQLTGLVAWHGSPIS